MPGKLEKFAVATMMAVVIVAIASVAAYSLGLSKETHQLLQVIAFVGGFALAFFK